MIRIAARRLWTRRLQALAPLVALLAATLGFQAVLVSARSTQSHVQGVIAANWNPPYDLLVRPPSLVTGLAPGDHLAQPNYLDSVGGGITLQQVGTVRAVPGVTVAAPLGVVATDYLRGFDYAIDVSTLPNRAELNLYRLTTTYSTDGGLSTIPTHVQYIVVQGAHPPYVDSSPRILEGALLTINGSTVQCDAYFQCFTAPNRLPDDPNALPAQENPAWKDVTKYGYFTALTVPIVAVDPVAEDQLFGVNHCVTSGRPLQTSDHLVTPSRPDVMHPPEVPVLVNGTPGFDEAIHVRIDMATSTSSLLPLLHRPPADPRDRFLSFDESTLAAAHLAFTPLPQRDTSLNAEWAGAHGAGFLKGGLLVAAADYALDILEPATFRGSAPHLALQPSGDPTGAFLPYAPEGGIYDVTPAAALDVPFHGLHQLVSTGKSVPFHSLNVLGQYDANCVSRAAPQLSKGAFDIYTNPDTTTAGGRRLGPNSSMSTLATPMPTLMTNLSGGRFFSDPRTFANGKGDAFLSVVRVKVSDTSQPGAASEARLQSVARDIHKRTGLSVDIIKGSSTEAMAVSVPAGNFGRPALVVTQDWMHENVAITFYNAINSTTVVMSVAVTVVAGLLTMQTTYATVRRRRGELVLLRAVGWPSWRLALLMELEVVGLGVLVALIALLAAGIIILANHPTGPVVTGILLAAPAAVALTALAGLGPAFTASRTRPLAALRGPGRLRQRNRRLIRGPFTLGIREALTTWRWQTLIGAIATAVGAMFLGAVLAIIHDFHTSLDGTALAQQLANEVGPFDVLLGVLAVLLGATTAVSVVLVATRERLPHFATLRALGWSRAKVARVVAGQALAVGLLGGVLGVIALSVVANRVKTGIALTVSSQLSPLLLGAATGIAAAIGAVRLVYRRVIVTVLRVG